MFYVHECLDKTLYLFTRVCSGLQKSVAVYRSLAGRSQRPRTELSTASQGVLITSVMIQIHPC